MYFRPNEIVNYINICQYLPVIYIIYKAVTLNVLFVNQTLLTGCREIYNNTLNTIIFICMYL